MEPDDVDRWRRMLGLTQAAAAEICGRQRDWLRKLEIGEIPIPRWFNYTVAWTYLYGTELPFGADDVSAKIREMRDRWRITQVELGEVLGLSRDVVITAEKGHPRPRGIVFAIAWIALYGSRLPFPTTPDRFFRCSHCGK